MPKKSPKEQCFEDTWKNFKDASGNKAEMEFQKPWGQGENNVWQSGYKNFWHAFNSFVNTLRGIETSILTQQIRYPDLTVTQNGSTSVIDMKFTRADGTADSWGNTPGKGNGATQLEDYNKINEQLNGKDPYNKDPSLSQENCKCNEPGGTAVAPVTVLKEVPSMDGKFFFSPLPEALPAPGGVTVPGVGGMLPEFVFP